MLDLRHPIEVCRLISTEFQTHRLRQDSLGVATSKDSACGEFAIYLDLRTLELRIGQLQVKDPPSATQLAIAAKIKQGDVASEEVFWSPGGS